MHFNGLTLHCRSKATLWNHTKDETFSYSSAYDDYENGWRFGIQKVLGTVNAVQLTITFEAEIAMVSVMLF